MIRLHHHNTIALGEKDVSLTNQTCSMALIFLFFKVFSTLSEKYFLTLSCMCLKKKSYKALNTSGELNSFE